MSHVAVDQLLYLMDQAFDATGQEHSLLANLRSVPHPLWLSVPRNGARLIRQIVGHVAACKYMYDNHAFGDGKLDWRDPAANLGCSREDLQSGRPMDSEPPVDDVIEWLTDGHKRLRSHVAALQDDDLLPPRMTNWGEPKETRWIIAAMIQHDLYHAGEINHIRATLQENDAWPEW